MKLAFLISALLFLAAESNAEVWTGLSGNLAVAGGSGVPAVAGAGGRSASVPHGNWIPLTEYARWLGYWTTTTNCGANPAVGAYSRAQAQAWLGEKLALGEHEYGSPDANKAGMQAASNPRLKFWIYLIDQTCIQGSGSATACNSGSWTEEDFLHTASPHTSGNRVTGSIFGSNRYLFNVKRVQTRQAIADYLLNHAKNVTQDDYVWLDEHGLTMGNMAIADGTNIDEYAGTAGASVAAYEADLTTQVGVIQSTLQAQGIRLIVNHAQNATTTSPNFRGEYTSNPGVGMTTEFAWRANQMNNGGGQWMGSWVSVINDVAQGGGVVDTLYNQAAGGYAGMVANLSTGGNYASALERGIMWRLAAYWLVYQRNVYFDLNMDFCVANPIANQWWPAYAYGDLGNPVALPDPNGYTQDAGWNNTCTSQNTWHPQIWHRAFPNGHVYVRPKDGYDCDAPDGTTVTITLSQPMKLLKGDGTFGAPQSTVDLRMQEGVIMVIN
jgi:hypothetical protein